MHILKDIAYNTQNTGDLYLPDTVSSAAVLVIHGGGWTCMERSSIAGVAEFLCENGLTVFNIDYRLAPDHPYPAGLNDCKDAVQWLIRNKTHGNFSEVFILGASAGGHYALMSGLMLSSKNICGIISISGIDDVFSDFRLAPERYALLLGHKPEQTELEKINPASVFPDDAPPVLLTHCRNDEVVPFSVCADFERKISGKKNNLTIYSYDLDRIHQGHAIWIPDSRPHKLYPDIEQVVLQFIMQIRRRNSNVKN